MENFVDTFSGNNYQIGEGNILPRYYADDNDLVVIGKDTSEKKITKKNVHVIFYGLRQIRLNQYDWKSGKKFPKCFSTNFINPTGGEEKQSVESCAACPLHEWSKDPSGKWIAPECSTVIETILYDLETASYAIIQWKKTSAKVWKHIEKLVFVNLSKMRHYNPQINPIQQFVFKLTSAQTTTNGMQHAIFQAKIERELTPDEKIKHCQAAQGAYKYLLLRQTSELLIAPGQDYHEKPRSLLDAPIQTPLIEKEEDDYDKAFADKDEDNYELPQENETFRTLEDHNRSVAGKGPTTTPPI